MRRALALVDGEHYPPVIRDAFAAVHTRGVQVTAAVVLGGTEKVAAHGADLRLGVPLAWAPRAADLGALAKTIAEAVSAHRPELVFDLSDEPVLSPRSRMQLAAVVLRLGLPYEGADFAFTPPVRPRLADRPTIAVIGTGKRTGKTAVSGAITRHLQRRGRRPVVVAMGRGGPPEPLVVPAGLRLGVEELLAVADAGGHAASDFYEDALTTGAATIGARRCGGGLVGAVVDTNVPAAMAAAGQLEGDVFILEGSGSAIPPAHADATVLVVPGDAEPELVGGYLGAYRLLLADVVIATMCEPPRSSAAHTTALLEAIRNISREVPVLFTVLRPVPLGPVAGTRVFFATTAPEATGPVLVDSLQERYDCEVVASSHHLADRPALQADLQRAPRYEVLLVECKAAAVDVAARAAHERGARVVFCDNRPFPVDHTGHEQETAVSAAVDEVAGLADRRFQSSSDLS